MKIEKEDKKEKDEKKNDKDKVKKEIGKDVYRKLLWFFEKKIPVHFCLMNRYGWKNGEIIDLDKNKLTLVLKEFKEGELPFLLEEINLNTIKPFKNDKQ